MVEKRKTARRRTLLGGRIDFVAEAARSVDCVVRNVSEGGVRMALRTQDLIPDRFSLAIAKGPLPGDRTAHLVWYRDGMAGVAFEASENADDAILAARIQSIADRSRAKASPRLMIVQ